MFQYKYVLCYLSRLSDYVVFHSHLGVHKNRDESVALGLPAELSDQEFTCQKMQVGS